METKKEQDMIYEDNKKLDVIKESLGISIMLTNEISDSTKNINLSSANIDVILKMLNDGIENINLESLKRLLNETKVMIDKQLQEDYRKLGCLSDITNKHGNIVKVMIKDKMKELDKLEEEIKKDKK